MPLITDNPAHPTAFRWRSVVAEKFIRDLKLGRENVAVSGGATGSILIGTLLDELSGAI